MWTLFDAILRSFTTVTAGSWFTPFIVVGVFTRTFCPAKRSWTIIPLSAMIESPGENFWSEREKEYASYYSQCFLETYMH
jgi:hypothetical protein